MGILAKIVSNFIHTHSNHFSDNRENYIFYKIVDYTQTNKEYTLQCINTKAIFHAKIADIVFDIDILHGLHPIQACFIGIEYANFLKSTDTAIQHLQQKNNLNKYSVFRYGNYQLRYQDRKNNVAFVNQKSGGEFLMDPRDIALSETLLAEFDAAQAFYIGLLAGFKLNNTTTTRNNISLVNKRPQLRIVK